MQQHTQIHSEPITPTLPACNQCHIGDTFLSHLAIAKWQQHSQGTETKFHDTLSLWLAVYGAKGSLAQILPMSLRASAPKSSSESMHDDATVTASFACMPESVTTQNDIGNLFCYELKHTNAVFALPNTCVLRLTGATEASNAPAHRWAQLLGMCLPMAGLSCCKMRLPMARLSCCKRRLRMARLSAYG